jgi:DNA-binding MarR family transcriptional regulator
LSGSPATELPSGLRLGNRIKQCEQALLAEKHRILRPYDLTVSQYAALLVLAENPRISSAHLARRCGVTAQAMNGVVSLLERRGLISRTSSEDHAKVLLIQLTDAGMTLLQQADHGAVAVERRLAGAFTPEQLTAFQDMLATAIEVLSAKPSDESG